MVACLYTYIADQQSHKSEPNMFEILPIIPSSQGFFQEGAKGAFCPPPENGFAPSELWLNNKINFII